MLRTIPTVCLILGLTLTLFLTACGQSGDLHLPPEEQPAQQNQ